MDIPDVSVTQAEFCKANNKLVSLDALQPGDIIFWQKTTCHCGRTDEVHHVGIYLGNGQVCEASFGKGRVVVGSLWETSKWKLLYAARPHV
ncbi:C40 family peptidase [Christensenellaceae bacterium OttesenSCG-928-K19]|nr:C40 family peptidase [Christensenellaceae bacterium OttesenSCG-928-K19]